MNILAISAHPDDETLGCGGMLLRHGANGDKLYWLIATEAHEPQWSRDVVERKTEEVRKVAKSYGVEHSFNLGYPTVSLETLPQDEIIEKIRCVVNEVQPELVYVVHGGDVHTDHQVIFNATNAVLRPFYMSRYGVRRFLCYETLSSTEAAPPLPDRAFLPNVFCDITPHLERKLQIMALYQTEVHPEPLPRAMSSIRALARYRGSTLGVEYAEAFMLIRERI